MTKIEAAQAEALYQYLCIWKNDDGEIVDVMRKSDQWVTVRFELNAPKWSCVNLDSLRDAYDAARPSTFLRAIKFSSGRIDENRPGLGINRQMVAVTPGLTTIRSCWNSLYPTGLDPGRGFFLDEKEQQK